MALASSVAGSMFMPWPGCTTLMTTRPTTSAMLLTISKYSSARPPVLPTFFMSSIPAMPTTTVQKMIGAMIILISLMKMIIAPIIFCTVVVGIAGMEDMKKVGKTGGLALLYFEVVSSVALVIGLVLVNVLQPGAGLNANPATLD